MGSALTTEAVGGLTVLEAEKSLRARLTEDLRAAMKSRDGVRVSAVRSLIAALDNASAVPVDDPQVAALRGRLSESQLDPAGAEGGSWDVPRKALSEEDILQVLAVEMAERRNAALALEKHGCYEEAAVVRGELEIIEGYAAGWAMRSGGSGSG